MNKILIVIVAIALDRIFKKTCPVLYKKLEFPTMIFQTVFVAVFSAFLCYGIYDVVNSAVNTADKVLFTLFCMGGIVIMLVATAAGWKRWWTERKEDTI